MHAPHKHALSLPAFPLKACLCIVHAATYVHLMVLCCMPNRQNSPASDMLKFCASTEYTECYLFVHVDALYMPFPGPPAEKDLPHPLTSSSRQRCIARSGQKHAVHSFHGRHNVVEVRKGVGAHHWWGRAVHLNESQPSQSLLRVCVEMKEGRVSYVEQTHVG